MDLFRIPGFDGGCGCGRIQVFCHRTVPRNPAPNGQGIDRKQLTDPALGRGKGDRGLEHSLKSRFDTIRRHFIASNELLRINCPLGLLNKGHRAQAPPPTTRDALSGRSGIGLCGDTARSLGDEKRNRDRIRIKKSSSVLTCGTRLPTGPILAIHVA